MAEKKCDFCSAHGADNPPVAVYGCKDFIHGGLGINFLDSWSACQHCDQLIASSNLRGLIDRAVATHIESHGLTDGKHFRTKEQIKHHVTEIHLSFWKNRTGERKEVESNG